MGALIRTHARTHPHTHSLSLTHTRVPLFHVNFTGAARGGGTRTYTDIYMYIYWVASISGLLKMIGLFCKRAL